MSQTPGNIAPIDLGKLETVFNHMALRGVAYGLGAKAPSMDCDSDKIERIDCSGFARYAIAKATGGELIIPDGSQNQRVWCDDMKLHRLARYSDVVYATPRRLFICFIKPFENGCGSVGHVWFVSQLDGDRDTMPDTMESHGGKGVDSRPWNTRVLKSEAFCAYELPVQAPA